MKENVLEIKSGLFANRIIRLHAYLTKNKKEYTISKQILRSGTSIGANIAESVFASSKKDFINKLQIARKESHETVYWLKQLAFGAFLTKQQFDSMNNDLDEIGKILTSSVQTAMKSDRRPITQ